MGASLFGSEGSRTKSESKLREAHSNWLQGKGRLIEMILGIQDTRIKANIKISVTGTKKSEVISSLFLTLALSLPFSLMILTDNFLP